MIQYQAYWLALVDLLLYITSNVMELTGKMVMGYVLYCSHENNGTFLPVGRIHMALRSPKKREKFRKSVLEHGMYSTLVARNLRLMLLNGKGQYSASGHPRHIANNRGGNKIPVLGDASLPTPRNEKEYNIVLEKLPSVCSKREQDFIDICHKYQEFNKPGTKRKRGGKQQVRSPLDEHANNFLESVKELGGKGVGHMFALNFVQLASVFGFIPTQIMTWSSIENPKSGGYQFIQHLYGNTLSTATVQEYFNKCVQTCQGIYGPRVTRPIVENLLCELWRVVDGKRNTKVDCFYGYDFRKTKENPSGAQSLFRMEIESPSCMGLEMRSPKSVPNQSERLHKYVIFAFNAKGICSSDKALASWEGPPNVILGDSVLKCSDTLTDLMQ